MREGPLAALFRKTTEEEGLGAAPRGSESPASPDTGGSPASASSSVDEPTRAYEPADRKAVEPTAERPADAPRSEATEQRDTEQRDKPAEPARPSIPEPHAKRVERRDVPLPSERKRDDRRPLTAERPWSTVRETYPHPSLAGDSELDRTPAAEPEPPSARERLRQAFVERDEPSYPPGDARREEQYVPTPLERFDPDARGRVGVGKPVLRVVGVGGAGVNAVNRMVEAEIEGVEFIAVNTDVQSLQQSAADVALHIGANITRGLGSGSDPELGRQAAMEEFDRLKALLKGADMVFVTAGSGGGTGTGAAPVVARIAREVGALTVGIVTKPFGFEGTRRSQQAEEGIKALSEEVDTLIVVPNNRLLSVLDKGTAMVEAFRVADDVLRQGVQGISDLVTLPGLINLDFADVRTIMGEAGNALLGIGMGVGERRALDAAEQAVSSPLLETSMDGARSILLSITGGRDLSLWEVNEAARAVSEAAHPDANIIFGAMVDEKLDDQVWITVVATGYENGRVPRKVQEPAGEPRVRRTSREPEPATTLPRVSRSSDSGRDLDELDVPEFIPRS